MSSEPVGLGERTETAAPAAEPLLAFADALLAESQPVAPRAASELRQYVSFALGDAEYGIPILQCREIVRLGAITRIPEAPEQVRGVVNLRGHIVPAVDARRCLGLEPAPATVRPRLLVVDVAGRQFGLIVDRVSRIVKLATSDVKPAEPAGSGDAIAHVDGVAIHLLDVERVLRGPSRAASAQEGEKP
jgi:purine-binding chemotaxis protein CheW